MMTNFKLGIIIPVYDNIPAFNFLLEGLANQYNFSDFYTIIINDNPQNSLIKSTCDLYKNKLHIFYIENKENIGPGLSRNKGLDWCQKHNIEYIIFIDSDDFMPPGTIKSLLHTIIKENADLVVGNFLTIYPHYDYIERSGFSTLPFIFAKIYRMSAIANLRFLDMKLLEDLTFNLMFLDQPRNVFYKEQSGLYFHYINKNSLTEKAIKSDDYKNSLPYYMLLAIYKYLQYSKQITIEDPFIIHYISNNLYILYEEGLARCPKNKLIFDNIINKILADQRIQNIFNNAFLYTSGNFSFCSQYVLSYDGRGFNAIQSKNQKIHFFNETIIDFFKKHGYNPTINFNILNNDENLYKI